MKKYIFAIFTFCIAQCLFAESPLIRSSQFSSVTDIDDLALIYIGGQHRTCWDREHLLPYVMHQFADGEKCWMFDGFLMLDFMRWNDNCKRVNLGEFNGDVSTQDDWTALLDEQLGTYSGNGCRALDNLIGELIPVLGRPSHKHKVVMCMPCNWEKGDWIWGNVNGDVLTGDDRVRAGQWYVDELLRRWEEAEFKNIELDGIYWTTESFHEDREDHVRDINRYCHDKDLLVYWVPYVQASGRDKWKDWGVDIAYLQPNYYFKEERPMSQLDGAIEFAINHDMGLEIEFAGYDLYWDCASGQRRQSAPANIGLFEINPNYYQRLVDYIDHFENQDIFNSRPIAYYSGFQGFYDFAVSDNIKDHEIIDRLALLIDKRHQISGWTRCDRK